MVPGDLAVEYYAQRASAALIVTEGTQPSAVGQGYLNTPGIHTPEQVAGWRRVAEAVHARGGRIVVQLMHVGRIAHPDNKDGLETIAPSALAAPDQMFTADGMKPFPVPREIATDEIAGRGRGVRARRALRGRGRAGRRRGARRQRLPASTSSWRPARTSAPTPTAAARRTGPASRSRSPAPWPRRSARSASASGSPRRTTSRARPRRTRPTSRRRTPRSSRRSPARPGLPQRAGRPVAGARAASCARTFGGVLVANTGFADVTTRASAQAVLDDGPRRPVAVGRLFLANPDLPERWRAGAGAQRARPGHLLRRRRRGLHRLPGARRGVLTVRTGQPRSMNG